MAAADSLGFGVIGVGAIGRLHAEHLAARIPCARLVAVADINIPAARAAAERLDVAAYPNHAALLADPGVTAVAICTPRETHAPIIKDAAAAGKHIFCEKPLAGSLEEIDDAMAAVARAGVMLQVGFNRRFDASFAHVHDTIAAGGIGAPQIIHIVSRDPEPADGRASRTPADLILETTIHDLDMARYLAGSEITSVHALGLPASEPGRLEGAIIVLSLATGVVATIDNHLRSAFGYDQRLEVFGTAGALSIANETPHRATLAGKAGIIDPLPLHFFAERYVDSYIAELSAFARCVAEKTAPPVTASDGRAAVVAALAALDSLREGRPVALA
ncbi:MAG: Gfo/Idh/MocA family oxidoreductase [Chloroflexota bacterium]|nr:Gfo/Idh/MocA family oxidoreductase [Chloroflexota bacterium]